MGEWASMATEIGSESDTKARLQTTLADLDFPAHWFSTRNGIAQAACFCSAGDEWKGTVPLSSP